MDFYLIILILLLIFYEFLPINPMNIYDDSRSPGDTAILPQNIPYLRIFISKKYIVCFFNFWSFSLTLLVQ
jgi:hypothetical protein